MVAKSMRAAQDAITNAQIALLTHDPQDFEIGCQKASDQVQNALSPPACRRRLLHRVCLSDGRCDDQVGDLSEIVSRERLEKDANTKIDTGRDILSKSTAMFREIETDAEILGDASDTCMSFRTNMVTVCLAFCPILRAELQTTHPVIAAMF